MTMTDTTPHYLMHRTVARGASPEHIIEVARLAVSEAGLAPASNIDRIEGCISKIKGCISKISSRGVFARERTPEEINSINTGEAVLSHLRREISRIKKISETERWAILADPDHPMHDYLRRGDL